ncbi:MAG: ATP-binding cassette domain-containing protein, partial [Nitrososphaerota archaeon]|nr:ATP-binding cassette domain-containing protein [Nitrososphaerota archaeon]
MTEVVFSGKGLTKYFEASRKGFVESIISRQQKVWVRAVDEIDFEIPAGEVLALVGESGSGKTTLGRAVVALTKPTSGEVIIDGKKVNFGRRKELKGLWKKVQMVFQDPYSTF